MRKQVVNIPSFLVRLDSQKHIDFALRSPLSSGGRPGISEVALSIPYSVFLSGRVKRKNMRKGEKGAGGGGGGGDEEADEE